MGVDMEKVINIYANCLLNDKQCCSDCYTGGPGLGIACRQQILTDALYLLKEQEERIEQLKRFVNGFSREAVHVVRCKDCKNHGTINCPMCEEANCTFNMADDWFCADGRRE